MPRDMALGRHRKLAYPPHHPLATLERLASRGSEPVGCSEQRAYTHTYTHTSMVRV